MQAIISIDYDDTIVYSDYPNIGTIKPHAADVINRLHDAGHFIIIWTCRSGEHETMAADYLRSNGVKFHHINENHPDNIAQYDSDSRKIFADVYVDDKQLGGLPESWLEIETILTQQINKLK